MAGRCSLTSVLGQGLLVGVMGSVVACLAAVTKYHRWGDLTSKPLFLPTLDAGKSEIELPADVVSGERRSSWLTDGYLFFLNVLFIFERETECEWGRGREKETQNGKQGLGSTA